MVLTMARVRADSEACPFLVSAGARQGRLVGNWEGGGGLSGLHLGCAVRLRRCGQTWRRARCAYVCSNSRCSTSGGVCELEDGHGFDQAICLRLEAFSQLLCQECENASDAGAGRGPGLQRHRKKSDKNDEKQSPKRTQLPAHLPRRDVPHEPADTTCGCGQAMQRIGEDVAEKLDYQPGVFTVERHVRGKWVCKCCERIVQAPVAAHVIDKGIPTTGLLAHVLVAKFMDHLPLYRQEAVFARAGHVIARSTLAEWVGGRTKPAPRIRLILCSTWRCETSTSARRSVFQYWLALDRLSGSGHGTATRNCATPVNADNSKRCRRTKRSSGSIGSCAAAFFLAEAPHLRPPRVLDRRAGASRLSN